MLAKLTQASSLSLKKRCHPPSRWGQGGCTCLGTCSGSSTQQTSLTILQLHDCTLCGNTYRLQGKAFFFFFFFCWTSVGTTFGSPCPSAQPCFPCSPARMLPRAHPRDCPACLPPSQSLSPEKSSCGTRDCPHPLLSSPESQAFLWVNLSSITAQGRESPQASFSGLTSISLQWHTPEQMPLLNFQDSSEPGPPFSGFIRESFYLGPMTTWGWILALPGKWGREAWLPFQHLWSLHTSVQVPGAQAWADSSTCWSFCFFCPMADANSPSTIQEPPASLFFDFLPFPLFRSICSL